jgi:glycosyltransferase involved in cell wall biosynthesis
MKISIVTVCFNASATIQACLASVADQTYPDIEHVIIDGQSSDTTLEIVRRFPHVAAVISEPDRGLYDAMNKGLSLISGDYVLFLNADDKFPRALTIAEAVVEIETTPGADVYYGALEVRPPSGQAYVFRPPAPEAAPEFMILGCLPHQSTLARPSVFDKTGRFDLQYRYHAEYDWFLKILADPTIDVRQLQATIGSFQEGGISSQLLKGQPEVFVIQKKSALYRSPEWDKIRISALQTALLRERIEVARLRDASCGAVRSNLNWRTVVRQFLPNFFLHLLRHWRARTTGSRHP